VTAIPAPAGWECGADTCTGLPPHTHVLVPFRNQPDLARNPYAATHRPGTDIDRIHIDWRTVAYEAMTGRRRLPLGQLTLDALEATP